MAIKDLTTAIGINPNISDYFYLRGICNKEAGVFLFNPTNLAEQKNLEKQAVFDKKAIKDLTKAIDLDNFTSGINGLGEAYYQRGLIRGLIHGFNEDYLAKNDMISASKLGHEEAQKYLTEKGWSKPETNRKKPAVSALLIAGIKMISIPPGIFSMGSNLGESNEKPVHTVTLDKFKMSATEITQGQYKWIMCSNPSYFSGSDDLPVERVSWYDAVKFCNRLSDKAGIERCYNESTWGCDFTKNGFRLPTEAEWEYACRAGTTTKYYTGDSENYLKSAGWYPGNSGSKTYTVGLKESNAWGFYDMHGNVREWCNDWYGSYGSVSVANPTGAYNGSSRVSRGGSWGNNANQCRSADRAWFDPTTSSILQGFRVVRCPGGVTY